MVAPMQIASATLVRADTLQPETKVYSGGKPGSAICQLERIPAASINAAAGGPAIRQSRRLRSPERSRF